MKKGEKKFWKGDFFYEPKSCGVDGSLDFRTLGAAGAQIDHHRPQNQEVGVVARRVIDGGRFLATCQVGIKAASDPFGEHKEAIAGASEAVGLRT